LDTILTYCLMAPISSWTFFNLLALILWYCLAIINLF